MTRFSVALSTSLNAALTEHLLRDDGQEDVCLAIYHPSEGATRTTAVLQHVVLPHSGERAVHGNASFVDEYFLRASAAAAEVGGGVAILHSHPRGRGWQGMSADDLDAECRHAALALSLTGQSLVGLTLAGDGTWSARQWPHTGRRLYSRVDAESVRVVGTALDVSHNPDLRPVFAFGESFTRTLSVWGTPTQQNLTRLRVGIVGLGSVGASVAEALGRTGMRDLVFIDYDTVRTKNLDRVTNATRLDAFLWRTKAEVAAEAVLRSSSAHPRIAVYESSVAEADGYRSALDCDVLFSCVDSHWARCILNTVAYGHLIPVIDGGVAAQTRPNGEMAGAHWRAQVAAPGRQCLQCSEQFDPGLVECERHGIAEDPHYIAGLPKDHPLLGGENVFAFSVGCASLEVLQLILMVAAPSGVSDIGVQDYQFVEGRIHVNEDECKAGCMYSNSWQGLGDHLPVQLTGPDVRAANERRMRTLARRHPGVRVARLWFRVAQRVRALAERVAGQAQPKSLG